MTQACLQICTEKGLIYFVDCVHTLSNMFSNVVQKNYQWACNFDKSKKLAEYLGSQYKKELQVIISDLRRTYKTPKIVKFCNTRFMTILLVLRALRENKLLINKL